MTRARILRPPLDIINAFRGLRVLIVGDVILDEYLWGGADRLSPEAPVPIVQLEQRDVRPGGAANAAANVAALGGVVYLSGVTGRDRASDELRAGLSRHGIASDGLFIDEQRPTTTKMRVMANSQQVARVDCERRADVPSVVEERMLHWVAAHLESADACILSDYAKGVVSDRLARDVIRMACDAGKLVVVDPKGAAYQKYAGACIITPNVVEAKRALGYEPSHEVLVQDVGVRLSRMLPGSGVLITRGRDGMSLYRDGKELSTIPAARRQVFDVTGAGDTVVSALTLALAAGGTVEQAMRLAVAAAGIVVTKRGTATATLDEFKNEAMIECGDDRWTTVERPKRVPRDRTRGWQASAS